MLVLSRHVSEGITIRVPGCPHSIRVVVVDIRGGDRVRLGIEAHVDVTINRDEIQAIIDAEGRNPA